MANDQQNDITLFLGASDENRILTRFLEDSGPVLGSLREVLELGVADQLRSVITVVRSSDEISGIESLMENLKKNNIHAPIQVLAPDHLIMGNDPTLLRMAEQKGLHIDDVTASPQLILARAKAANVDRETYADMSPVWVIQKDNDIGEPEVVVFHRDSRLVGGIPNALRSTRPRKLTEREGILFATLLLAKGEVLKKETILGLVWPLTAARVTTHTLETHIYRLRATKLIDALTQKVTFDDEAARRFIIQQTNGGYRIDGEIRRFRSPATILTHEAVGQIVRGRYEAAGLEPASEISAPSRSSHQLTSGQRITTGNRAAAFRT